MITAIAVLFMLTCAAAHADAPLSQGFEDGAPGWSMTGMWHVQTDPQQVQVIPAIAQHLVTLPDAGYLPAAEQGSSAAWFGEASTGTYCGSDYMTVKQTPNDGCTSAHQERGTLTSPSFSLAGRSSAFLVFRGWWEIEASHATISDLMQVQYSTDGGASWTLAGSLNPLDPSWGGNHQPFTDGGARQSGSWSSYVADLSGAAGATDVRVRFVFDTVDVQRNGFRGLLVDGVAIVDPLGATISEPQAIGFTDASPTLSLGDPELTQGTDGTWSVDFTIDASHPSTHTVGTDWTVDGVDGTPVAHGHVDIPPGQTHVTVSVPVSGGSGPYTSSISNPTGGATLSPGSTSATTPGGALPVLTLDGVTATPSLDGGTVSVDIVVHLSQPAAGPVSIDYTLTGSDGVVAGGGTITIPPGATTASTTVTAPADHAPYTVGLSNPRGLLLDPSHTVATTTPLAGTAQVGSVGAPGADSSLGSQLVLGVRIAAGQGPTLDKTFLLTNASGQILYHLPGGKYQTLANGTTVRLPFGTVVDATNGHAIVTVEVDAQHTLQQGEFWAGKFGVFQAGSPAVTELRLAGGDYGTCATGSRTRAKRSAQKVVRSLWANAKGRFRTKGRFASATVRGTQWQTEDLCLATRITVLSGIVGVLDFRRKTTTAVPAGHSVTVGALQSARYRRRRGVHGPRLSRLEAARLHATGRR